MGSDSGDKRQKTKERLVAVQDLDEWGRTITEVQGRPEFPGELTGAPDVPAAMVESESFISEPTNPSIPIPSEATEVIDDELIDAIVDEVRRGLTPLSLPSVLHAELYRLDEENLAMTADSREMAPADDASMPTPMREWLHAISALEGSHHFRIGALPGNKELSLVVADGRVCFGPLLNARPFVDTQLRREHNELFHQLAAIFSTRADDPHSPLFGLVERHAVTLEDDYHWALARLVTRVIARAAQLAGTRARVVTDPLDLGERDVVTFSTLELLMAHHLEHGVPHSAPQGRTLERYQHFAPDVDDSWLFARGRHELQLIATAHTTDKHIAHAEAASALARQLDRRLVESDEHICFATAGGQVWCLTSDAHLVCLLRAPNHLMGRLLHFMSRPGTTS